MLLAAIAPQKNSPIGEVARVGIGRGDANNLVPLALQCPKHVHPEVENIPGGVDGNSDAHETVLESKDRG